MSRRALLPAASRSLLFGAIALIAVAFASQAGANNPPTDATAQGPLSAPPPGKMYWTAYWTDVEPNIQRADLDGNNVEDLVKRDLP